MIKTAINIHIQSVEKKILKLQAGIEKRKAISKIKFPNQNVLEIENIQDGISLAELFGMLKAFKIVKKM